MLDIKFIREHSDIVRKDLEKRNDEERLKWIDDILGKDRAYRTHLQEVEKLRHEKNILAEEINKLKKQGKDISEKLELARKLPKKIKDTEEKIAKIKEKLLFYQMRLPNILHESVPFGVDSTENKVLRTWGEKPKHEFKLKDHGTILEEQGLVNFDDAARVAGNGFYYLLGDFALLEMALTRFAVDCITKKGYKLVQPPLMLRKKPYEGVTDLADFETMMYKIDKEDLYLIATSEHPIAAMLMGKVFDEKELPLKLCGISPCFRKEIGSHGIDTKGLFRVHQFNKVEQFIFCRPEESWIFHEELIKNAEEIFQKLKLPYRVANICTGDIGIVAAKKYDIEVYMPREKVYREVVSCSNCTAYQATRLNIKYRKGNEKEYIHTLNSTAVATGRALRAIVEHYQQKDGTIKVPTVLQPYMDGIKKIGSKE